MPNSRRLTPEEIDQRNLLEADRHEKNWNEPERVAAREWVKSTFKSDIDAICNFAAIMMEDDGDETENRELVELINRMRRNGLYLAETTELSGELKCFLAIRILQRNPADPAALAFMSGLSVSKHLKATSDARKRHAENYAMKADVFLWLDANMANYRSMDSAAEAIFGKVAPIKFRTARVWVGQWKKIQSAGTP
jgi:hypothetical protein